MKNKPFNVDIEFDTITLHVKAKNKTEARKKALKMLSKKNPCNLIKKSWPDHKKCISVEEAP